MQACSASCRLVVCTTAAFTRALNVGDDRIRDGLLGAIRHIHQLIVDFEVHHKLDDAKCSKLWLVLRNLVRGPVSSEARLATGYLKHKREVAPRYHDLKALEFSRRWKSSDFPKGLLVFALLRAYQS